MLMLGFDKIRFKFGKCRDSVNLTVPRRMLNRTVIKFISSVEICPQAAEYFDSCIVVQQYCLLEQNYPLLVGIRIRSCISE